MWRIAFRDALLGKGLRNFQARGFGGAAITWPYTQLKPFALMREGVDYEAQKHDCSQFQWFNLAPYKD